MRLGKRERAAKARRLDARKRWTGVNIRTSLQEIHIVGKPMVDWSWNWRTNKRIRRESLM